MTDIELSIEDLGQQGDGIAKEGQHTVFVAGTLAGEKVKVRTHKEKDGTIRGELIEILSQSPARVRPPCPHFSVCGGCRFQYMEAQTYATFKHDRLRSILKRGGIEETLIETPVITAPATRRRARFAAQGTAKGVILGFNGWHSHHIVDVHSCPVLLPRLQALIEPLRAELATYLPVRGQADIQVTLLPEGLDVVVIGGPKLDLNARQNLAEMAQKLDIAHLSWRKDDRSDVEPIAHIKPLPIQFGETRLSFPPAAFLQATETGEAALIHFTQEAKHKGLRVLDLFSGLGTFGLSLTGAKKVHFVDVDGPSMQTLDILSKQEARYTAERRNLMKDPISSGECNDYDLVIFDPPRAGAIAQAKELAQSNVPQIIAISCDPTSFTRDAAALIDGGYELRRLLPVDQFLWSPHMELAAHFVRVD